MKTRIGNRILGFAAAQLIAASLCVGAFGQSPAQNPAANPPQAPTGGFVLPEITVPAGYEEGWAPSLGEIEIGDAAKFAKNGSEELKEILSTVAKLSDYWQKRELLLKEIDAFLKKYPLRTDLLMRSVLERSVIITGVIDGEIIDPVTKEPDLMRKGVVDQEVRLMQESIKMAIGYWEPFLKYVNGETVEKNVDLAKLRYRDFGIRSAALLMSVADSVFDASAEYRIRIEVLKLLLWDLNRDENRYENSQAGVIVKLHGYLRTLPNSSNWSDDEYVDATKMVRDTYRTALNRLGPAARSTQSPNGGQQAGTAGGANAPGGVDVPFVIENPTYPGTNIPFQVTWYSGTNYNSETGICKLLGYEKAVLRGSAYGNPVGSSLKIGDSGQILRMLQDEPAVTKVICVNQIVQNPIPPMNLKTLENPAYPASGLPFQVAWYSGTNYNSENGICKALGFESAVTRSSRYTNSSGGSTIKVDEQGNVVRAVADEPTVSRIVCVAK